MVYVAGRCRIRPRVWLAYRSTYCTYHQMPARSSRSALRHHESVARGHTYWPACVCAKTCGYRIRTARYSPQSATGRHVYGDGCTVHVLTAYLPTVCLGSVVGRGHHAVEQPTQKIPVVVLQMVCADDFCYCMGRAGQYYLYRTL